MPCASVFQALCSNTGMLKGIHYLGYIKVNIQTKSGLNSVFKPYHAYYRINNWDSEPQTSPKSTSHCVYVRSLHLPKF